MQLKQKPKQKPIIFGTETETETKTTNFYETEIFFVTKTEKLEAENCSKPNQKTKSTKKIGFRTLLLGSDFYRKYTVFSVPVKLNDFLKGSKANSKSGLCQIPVIPNFFLVTTKVENRFNSMLFCSKRGFERLKIN